MDKIDSTEYVKFLKNIKKLDNVSPFTHGKLIAEMRSFKSLRLVDIANSLNVAETCVHYYEHKEPSMGISLRSMQKIAESMDCKFVYYFIPNNIKTFKES